jgi:hypothetical protein
MTTTRLARLSQRQTGIDTASPPGEQAPPGPWPDRAVRAVRGIRPGICCHGDTVTPIQRQFQFRNLSDDPRLNLRLAGILIPARGTD